MSHILTLLKHKSDLILCLFYCLLFTTYYYYYFYYYQGCLTGTVRKDEGKAIIAPKLRCGYLRQTAVAGSTKTVYEEASSEMHEINNAKSKMEKAQQKVIDGDTSDETLAMLDDATTEFTNVGGWSQEQDVDTVLKGLGFQPEDSDRLCSDFSGGWQMRIALARLLLSRPNILLLDEPR